MARRWGFNPISRDSPPTIRIDAKSARNEDHSVCIQVNMCEKIYNKI